MGDSGSTPSGAYRAILTTAVATFAALFIAAPAQGATVSAIEVDDGWDDYCGEPYEVRYAALPGERNDVQITGKYDEHFPAPWAPGPICWQMTPAVVTISDLTAPITTSGSVCQPVDGKGARCTASWFTRATVWAGDLRDLVKVGRETPATKVAAGPGDDAVNTANGDAGDEIFCGVGNDGATGDPGDVIAADCETVTRIG